MEVLRIISASWPLAVMFIALCLAGVVLYIVNWFKRSDLDDKALRASQARAVQRMHGDHQ
jgi:hypothetical protein